MLSDTIDSSCGCDRHRIHSCLRSVFCAVLCRFVPFILAFAVSFVSFSAVVGEIISGIEVAITSGKKGFAPDVRSI